jgi:DNA-binding transcriptional LysR family regulator
MAQPPLSQSIRKLEEALGVPLLERTSRVVNLTEAGRVFVDQARAVLATFERAVGEARRVGGAAGSVFRIGSAPLLPIQPLVRFLGALHDRDPRSHTEVAHLPSVEQVRRLRRGELDLGIFARVEDIDGLEIQSLFPGEPLAAFVPVGDRLAAETEVTPAHLRDEVLVTIPRSTNPPLYAWLLARAADAGYGFTAIHEAAGFDPRDLVLAVASGAGIAILPRSLEAANQVGIVAVRALSPPLSMPETVIAWSANPTTRLAPLIAVAREAARDLAENPPGADRDVPRLDPTPSRIGRSTPPGAQ